MEPIAVCRPGAGATALAVEGEGVGALLRAVFLAFDRGGVPYCVMHGYEGYPDAVTSDVDCVMPAEFLPGRLARFLHAERDRIGADLVQWLADDAHYLVLSGRPDGGPPRLLALHASPGHRVGDRGGYSAEEVLRGRRRRGAFWVPEPRVEFAASLTRRVAKGTIGEGQAAWLTRLFREDPDGCRREIGRFWGGRTAARIADDAGSSDWSWVRAELPRIGGELRGPITPGSIAAGFRRRWSGLRDRAARWRSPRGLHVVFLGPDGVGKSTVIDLVLTGLRPAFAGTTYRSFAPMLTRRPPPPHLAPKPHELKNRSRLASLAKAAYWLVYYTIGYAATVYRDRAGAALAVNHRYLVDALVDPRRYRYSGPVGLLRLIWKVAPKPDLVVLLDAPAEVVQARKREVPLEETARQLAAYRALAATLPNARPVDADQPVEKVVADVEAAILRELGARARRRLGLNGS